MTVLPLGVRDNPDYTDFSILIFSISSPAIVEVLAKLNYYQQQILTNVGSLVQFNNLWSPDWGYFA